MSVQASMWAIDQQCTTATEKAVLLVVASYAGPDGTCYPGQETIARQACCSVKTVERSLAAFEERGWITRRHRQRRDGSRTSDLIYMPKAPNPEPYDQTDSVSVRPNPTRQPVQSNPTACPIQPDTVSGLTTFEPLEEPLEGTSIVAEATKAPKQVARSYPEEFEAAWKAYPHHKGRSSKPNAAALFAKLPADERAGMVAAIERFKPEVAETCGGKGAPDMAVWLKAGKHLNWLQAEPTEAARQATFDGPPKLRQAIVEAQGEPYARSYLDPARWDDASRTVFAANAYAATKLRHDFGDLARRWQFLIAERPANDHAPHPAQGEAA